MYLIVLSGSCLLLHAWHVAPWYHAEAYRFLHGCSCVQILHHFSCLTNHLRVVHSRDRRSGFGPGSSKVRSSALDAWSNETSCIRA